MPSLNRLAYWYLKGDLKNRVLKIFPSLPGMASLIRHETCKPETCKPANLKPETCKPATNIITKLPDGNHLFFKYVENSLILMPISAFFSFMKSIVLFLTKF